MNKKRSNGHRAGESLPAQQALVEAARGAEGGSAGGVIIERSNPVEGGFSTTSPEIYPEGLVENQEGSEG